MATIVTRAGKGSPLTHTEVDTNFTNLNTNKLEAGAIALGSAATPSISFTGDTNTGIYSPGADQVAVATNGVERVEFGTAEVVFNDGGTDYDFRVKGDTSSHLLFVDASTDRVGIGTSDVRGTLGLQHGNTSPQGLNDVAIDALRISQTVGGIVAIRATQYDAANQPAAGDTQFFNLYFNGSTYNYYERMRIMADGRVGIGTTGPSKLLTIGSSTTANTTVRVNNSFTAGSDTGMYSFGLDDSADFAGMKLNYSDRVAKGLQIFTTSGYGYPISFSTNGSQNMTIDTSGRLLVGMSSDLTGALLQVNGAMNSNKYQQNVTAGSTDTIFTMAASQCYHIYCTEGTNQTHSVAIASCAEGSSTAVLTSLYQSSANTVLSSSGLNIQVYNGAGSTRTMKTTILRMA